MASNTESFNGEADKQPDRPPESLEHVTFYKGQINQLDIRFRKLASDYYDHAPITVKQAHDQVLADVRAENEKHSKNGLTCTSGGHAYTPGKFSEYEKMKSKECGHILCRWCVDFHYGTVTNKPKCKGAPPREVCNLDLKDTDFKPYSPLALPTGYNFGEIPKLEPGESTLALGAAAVLPPSISITGPRIPRNDRASSSFSEDGLFVPDYKEEENGNAIG